MTDEKKTWQPSRTDWQDPASAGLRYCTCARARAHAVICIWAERICGPKERRVYVCMHVRARTHRHTRMHADGKGVQKTVHDVEELTKNVDVVGKRDALLASSSAAEEASKVATPKRHAHNLLSYDELQSLTRLLSIFSLSLSSPKSVFLLLYLFPLMLDRRVRH